ncbi:DUF4249 family protein [Spirosoma telluris]|uniref:DUF4249 family protein n=1 Tax=Spirosoma telluris TaxID=2183553 RepID=UPI0038CD9F85
MTSFFSPFRLSPLLLVWLLLVSALAACVDPEDLMLRGSVDIIVVDGTVTNLAEEQIIRLNRSKSDPLTGRFGSRPITKATVEVVMDSALVIPCHETVDGSYQLPSDFKGQIGHAYQLRFTLTDGTQYVSNQQLIQTVPPIDKVSSHFNPKSIFPPLNGFYTAAHDLFVDFNDPAETRNYYRWDWKLYEKQEWCRSCYRGCTPSMGISGPFCIIRISLSLTTIMSIYQAIPNYWKTAIMSCHRPFHRKETRCLLIRMIITAEPSAGRLSIIMILYSSMTSIRMVACL